MGYGSDWMKKILIILFIIVSVALGLYDTFNKFDYEKTESGCEIFYYEETDSIVSTHVINDTHIKDMQDFCDELIKNECQCVNFTSTMPEYKQTILNVIFEYPISGIKKDTVIMGNELNCTTRHKIKYIAKFENLEQKGWYQYTWCRV